MKLSSFKNHKYRHCHGIDHKEGHCPPKIPQSKCRRGNVKQHSQSQIKSTFETFKVGLKSKRNYVNRLVNGKPIRRHLDTASDTTLIFENTWSKLGCQSIQPTEHVARSASEDIVRLTGEVMCEVKLKDHKFDDICHLIIYHDLDLLGLKWIEKTDILNSLLNEVCSHKPSFESVQISHNISKSMSMM